MALTPLHRAWRLLPAGPRRWALHQATMLAAPRPDRVPPPAAHGIAVGGELSRPSGLGEGARLMRHALDVLEVPNWGLDFGDQLPGGAPTLPKDNAPPGAPLVIHINPLSLPRALMQLKQGELRGRRVIGYWAWELPVAPPSWATGLRYVHEVWVPSRFTADALAPLATRGGIPLRVVPHPVAVAPPQPSARDRAGFGLPADAVVVLCAFNLASSMVRKNPLAAIAAFRQAFGDRADRLLVLKIGHIDHFPDDFALIRAAAAGSANIRLETAHTSQADSHALTRCVDIVLSLHRSEGFGLVPAEAMLLGRPVVATGWSGNMEFMDNDCAALVGYRLVPATDPRGVLQAPGAQWAEPDIAEAAAHLVNLADDPEARAALGERGRQAATERLGAAPLSAALTGLGLAR
jgi:glycosyltransferase involved in cell wall biosynthesis